MRQLMLMFLFAIVFGQNRIEYVDGPGLAGDLEIVPGIGGVRFNDPTVAYVLELESGSVILTEDTLIRMTEDELKDFFVLYILVSSWAYYLSDSVTAEFFGRQVTVSNDERLEIVCRKFIPEWVFDEPINREENQ